MEPLNLELHPPRNPREKLGGLTMLPRTIDKARALLPGGKPGAYFISPGMSEFLLGKLGVTEGDFIAIVAAAENDEAVLRALPQDRIEPERCSKLSGFIETLTVGNIPGPQRESFDSLYGPQDPNALAIDVLIEDDRDAFAPLSP
jgi:hypothetical protein